jgi:hypothetical protein
MSNQDKTMLRPAFPRHPRRFIHPYSGFMSSKPVGFLVVGPAPLFEKSCFSFANMIIGFYFEEIQSRLL